MSDEVSDEIFARHAIKTHMVTFEQMLEARHIQALAADRGVHFPISAALITDGVITETQRDNLIKAIQSGGQAGLGLTQLGGYRLIKKLGEGGMGAVYLAEDALAGRKVALKVLPEKFANDPKFISRFQREARATGKLNHPNIVSAFTVGEEFGNHYYTMEYCEGEALDVLLRREEFLPWDKAIEIVMQVARGLNHAHEHGLVHRDIKPQNIFLNNGGIVKILDLGLSKKIDDCDQSYQTEPGVALGTPHYMSPEQARGDDRIDGRSDIYSLGATLYHLVTGCTPFKGGMVIMKHLNEKLSNPQDIRGDIPDGIVLLIQKMMAKSREDRYQNCVELLRDLELVSLGKVPVDLKFDAEKSSIEMPKVTVPCTEIAARKRQPGMTDPGRTGTGRFPPIGTGRHQPVGTGRHSPVSSDARSRRQEKPVAIEPGARLSAPMAARVTGDRRRSKTQSLTPQQIKLYLTLGGLGLAVVLLVVAVSIATKTSTAEATGRDAAGAKAEIPVLDPPGLVAEIFESHSNNPFDNLPQVKAAGRTTVADTNFADREALVESFGRSEYVAIRFSGFIAIPRKGRYSFFSASDDGSRLFIDNQPIIDNNGLHAAIEKTGEVMLNVGRHAFMMEYFQANGDATLQLAWSGPGIPKALVPHGVFSHSRTVGVDTAEGAPMPIKLFWHDFQGGREFINFFNKGANGRAIWGRRSGQSVMTANVVLNATPDQAASMRVVAMPNIDSSACRISIYVNGKIIFNGPDPSFTRERAWTDFIVTIPAGCLQSGGNAIQFVNEEDSAKIDSGPWFMLNHVELKFF